VTQQNRALWVSTSMQTRGGISTFVRTVRETPFWSQWHVRHVATHRNGSVATKIIAFGIGALHFLAELVFRRPDVVHINTSSNGSFYRKSLLAWISWAWRVPVVMHVHGSEFQAFFAAAPGPVRLLIRTTLERADTVIALGDTWAQRLRDIAPRADVLVVPNAIRPQSQVEQQTAGPVHVLFLGAVGDRKGTFVLLDAWAKMMADGGGDLAARLTIAGDGEVERARRQVTDLGVDASVDVCGWIPNADVPALLSSAQVLVLPSQNEGQPMAILEAMARGICVVASNAGGIPELLDESCGVLVHPNDVTELAVAITAVVTDRDMRARVGANAFRRVQSEFDVDVIARRFDELYRQIVRRRVALPGSIYRLSCRAQSILR
jgi:glycosyltransferase involved in cell wall biosynthesis